MINPYNYPFEILFNDTKIPEDDYFASLPFYQLLREKERLIEEYKFKYETTKSMYKDMIKAMKESHEKSLKPQKIGLFVSEILDIFLEEVEKLSLSQTKIKEISNSLFQKFDKVLTKFEFPGFDNEEEMLTSSKKQRQIEANLGYLQHELSLKRESDVSKSHMSTHINISPVSPEEIERYKKEQKSGDMDSIDVNFKRNDSTGENSKGDCQTESMEKRRESFKNITNIFDAMRMSQKSECMRQESLGSDLGVQSSMKQESFLQRIENRENESISGIQNSESINSKNSQDVEIIKL